MKPKTKLTSRPVAEIVAAGEAEVGMQQIVAILPVKGAELVGPLPGELRNVIIYAAGISSSAGGLRRRAASSISCAPNKRSSLFAPRAWSRADWPAIDGADVLAPSRFVAVIVLTSTHCADKYAALYGRR